MEFQLNKFLHFKIEYWRKFCHISILSQLKTVQFNSTDWASLYCGQPLWCCTGTCKAKSLVNYGHFHYFVGWHKSLTKFLISRISPSLWLLSIFLITQSNRLIFQKPNSNGNWLRLNQIVSRTHEVKIIIFLHQQVNDWILIIAYWHRSIQITTGLCIQV